MRATTVMILCASTLVAADEAHRSTEKSLEIDPRSLAVRYHEAQHQKTKRRLADVSAALKALPNHDPKAKQMLRARTQLEKDLKEFERQSPVVNLVKSGTEPIPASWLTTIKGPVEVRTVLRRDKFVALPHGDAFTRMANAEPIMLYGWDTSRMHAGENITLRGYCVDGVEETYNGKTVEVKVKIPDNCITTRRYKSTWFGSASVK